MFETERVRHERDPGPTYLEMQRNGMLILIEVAYLRGQLGLKPPRCIERKAK